jgi:hypothetical protein
LTPRRGSFVETGYEGTSVDQLVDLLGLHRGSGYAAFGIASDPEGWRGPGTHLPGVLIAGAYHPDGDRVFWDVHDPARRS